MSSEPQIIKTQWDTDVFGIETFEVTDPSPDVLDKTDHLPGHYTVRVEPLSSTKLLYQKGFYYCDTLIEPYCMKESFIFHEHGSVLISQDIDIDKAAALVRGAFRHGRFHRDFNINDEDADRRYENWLRELHGKGGVFALLYDQSLAGFLGHDQGRIVLHALASDYRGRGLAKYLWSPCCKALFERGCNELTSSVSASNVAVLNLYASLGFRFRNPLDIYHKIVRAPDG